MGTYGTKFHSGHIENVKGGVRNLIAHTNKVWLSSRLPSRIMETIYTYVILINFKNIENNGSRHFVICNCH
jgi:hypothetical protein